VPSAVLAAALVLVYFVRDRGGSTVLLYLSKGGLLIGSFWGRMRMVVLRVSMERTHLDFQTFVSPTHISPFLGVQYLRYSVETYLLFHSPHKNKQSATRLKYSRKLPDSLDSTLR
jgi:hypothetical protein